MRDLIRDDEKRKAQDKLEALLLAEMESSAATEMTSGEWGEIRAEAIRQFEARKSGKPA